MPDPQDQQRLDAQLRALLAPGETVLWSGSPDPKAYRTLHSGGGWAALIFAVVGLGVPAYWISMIDTKDAGFWFSMLLFSLFGFMGLWGFTLPRRAQQQAGRTLYAITGRRALIVMINQPPESIALEQLESISVTERRDRSGDLMLRFEYDRERDQTGAVRRDRFVGLPRVREVAAILRRAASGEPAPAPAAPGTTRLPADAPVNARRLLPWLDADEHITWAGKPSPRVKLSELWYWWALGAIWVCMMLVLGAALYFPQEKLVFAHAVVAFFYLSGSPFQLWRHVASWQPAQKPTSTWCMP